jgi:hypothetical protein
MSITARTAKIARKWKGKVRDSSGDEYEIEFSLKLLTHPEGPYTLKGEGSITHKDYDTIPVTIAGYCRMETSFYQFDYENIDESIEHFGTVILKLSRESDTFFGKFIGRSPVRDDPSGLPLVEGTMSLA